MVTVETDPEPGLMAKKKAGRPKRSSRKDVTVKMDEAIVRDAKSIANWRGIPVAEYLSELVRPLVARDIRLELAKRTKDQEDR